MKTILIEEKPLLRFGILHSLKQVDLLMEIEELPPQKLSSTDTSADLVVLSLAPDDDARDTSESVADQLHPSWMLLLVDSLAQIDSSMLPAAVCGVLPKSASLEMLSAAIRLILAGGKCFPSMERPGHASGSHPLVQAIHADRLISAPRALPGAHIRTPHASAAHDAIGTLADVKLLQITARQYEVLILLARGYSIKAISRALEISVATTKAHTRTLYYRLNVRNKSEAVYAAMQRGATLDWQGPQAVKLVGG